MKVRFVTPLEDWTLADLTLGQVYEVTSVNDIGDVIIIDDAGETNGLYFGEYEVVDAD